MAALGSNESFKEIESKIAGELKNTRTQLTQKIATISLQNGLKQAESASDHFTVEIASKINVDEEAKLKGEAALQIKLHISSDYLDSPEARLEFARFLDQYIGARTVDMGVYIPGSFDKHSDITLGFYVPQKNQKTVAIDLRVSGTEEKLEKAAKTFAAGIDRMINATTTVDVQGKPQTIDVLLHELQQVMNVKPLSRDREANPDDDNFFNDLVDALKKDKTPSGAPIAKSAETAPKPKPIEEPKPANGLLSSNDTFAVNVDPDKAQRIIAALRTKFSTVDSTQIGAVAQKAFVGIERAKQQQQDSTSDEARRARRSEVIAHVLGEDTTIDQKTFKPILDAAINTWEKGFRSGAAKPENVKEDPGQSMIG